MFKEIRKTLLDVNASSAKLESGKTLAVGASALAAGAAASPMVFADGGISTLFSEIKSLLKEVFDGVNSIITAATVVVIGLGFLIRIFSKNQRTVDEATTWIKRAVITLIVWKFLGLFLDTLTSSSSGNEYKWN